MKQYDRKAIYDIATLLLSLIAMVMLIFFFTGCNTKKHVVENKNIDVVVKKDKDSVIANKETVTQMTNEIFNNSQNTAKDLELVFEGEIETVDTSGNKTKLNGKLNIKQAEKDSISVTNIKKDTVSHVDSVYVRKEIINDSIVKDKSTSETTKKVSSLPTQIIIVSLVVLAILIIYFIWKRKYKR